jgi:hypothetical protein
VSRSWIAVAVALFIGLGAAAAFAASLSVTSEKLAIYDQTVTRTTKTCTAVTGIEDAFAQQDQATTTHNGTSLDVQFQGTKNRHAFIRFDLTGCGIPSGASADSAPLTLFLFTAPSHNKTYEVYRVTGSWSQSTLTWSNQPGVAGSTTGTFTTGTTNNVSKSVDVTADVNAFLSGTSNQGWRINDSGGPTDLGQFASSENGTASSRPTLTVTYVT